ncbi:hypothetical protein [Calidifontibacter indicus]|uniref:hypothetical protein n=1 Tax=Calidifontibacter indicus TaxID=419650 RepID=UPI003D7527A2
MSATFRRALYIIGVIGGAAVTWALAKGWIDTADGAFATAILAALNGLAAVNTTGSTPVTIDQPATIIPGTTLDVPALDVAHSSDAKADAAGYDPKHDAPEGE